MQSGFWRSKIIWDLNYVYSLLISVYCSSTTGFGERLLLYMSSGILWEELWDHCNDVCRWPLLLTEGRVRKIHWWLRLPLPPNLYRIQLWKRLDRCSHKPCANGKCLCWILHQQNVFYFKVVVHPNILYCYSICYTSSLLHMLICNLFSFLL